MVLFQRLQSLLNIVDFFPELCKLLFLLSQCFLGLLAFFFELSVSILLLCKFLLNPIRHLISFLGPFGRFFHDTIISAYSRKEFYQVGKVLMMKHIKRSFTLEKAEFTNKVLETLLDHLLRTGTLPRASVEEFSFELLLS